MEQNFGNLEVGKVQQQGFKLIFFQTFQMWTLQREGRILIEEIWNQMAFIYFGSVYQTKVTDFSGKLKIVHLSSNDFVSNV